MSLTHSILIVDDEPNNIQLLGNLLTSEGYQIEFAMDGASTLNWFDHRSFDLILLDVMMPKMDGFEVCERLKSNEATQSIPVIFLTGKTDIESVIRGFKVGAVDYVTKPFQKSELLARVGMHLALQDAKAEVEKKHAEQKELLHVLCHDLMNPIASVIGYLEILAEDASSLPQVLPHMKSSMENAKNVINLIRTMEAVEDKKIQIEVVPVHLKTVIEESVLSLRQLFSKKQISVDVQIDESIWILAEHASMVNSVLNNLLTNANKFSNPESKVILEGRELNQFYELKISDFGVGIPESLLADLFSPHKPTTRMGTQGERGTGFGMMLVKKFVTAYGGTLEVQSKDEKSFPDDHGTQVILQFLKADS